MGAQFSGLGKSLIIIGLLLVAVGAIFTLDLNLPLGRLPGDIRIERENFSFYLPITTSIILSIVLSLLLKFFR
ncbi:DUF2905 domain-containing protein [Acetohalobium arabaticum]|uniref:DUF2905 domain-containing protein n=1 Tax=Acetohalobium arabaticum (strain ATCC 49924 / DSM 5501 / Z-7288) TaxID=574087 RepID=D9QVI5_ACEAZ|nr:DUF2905 domain-containing protein [Acetohalobium arabaticum]ADL12244.1 conserved hypothetical protein [Acetohalobium arabaticum DSM 5501]